MMVKRILTSVIGIPLLLLVVIMGGGYLRFAAMLISLVGMYEFYTACSKSFKPVHAVGMAFCVVYYFMLRNEYFQGVYVMLSAFIILLLVFLVIHHEKINIVDCSITFFGFFYVGFLVSNVYLVREFNEFGKYFVWLIFICSWACDTGAYFVGITLGKHKLIPKLSPKKTVEGAIGGTLTATAVSLIYGIVLSSYVKDMNIALLCAVIGFIGSILSQLGDLTASAIKRYTGKKDFGNILPGHGGILDRFDSVLFTAPAVYLLMRVIFYIR